MFAYTMAARTLPCSLGHLTDSASFQSTQLILKLPRQGPNTCPAGRHIVCYCVQGHSPPTSRPALVACLQLCLLAEMVACTVSVPILTGERHWRPMLVSRAWTVCYLPSCGTEGLQSNRQVHSAERLLRCCCKKQQQPGARGASQLGPIRKRQASQGFKLAAAVPTWGHTLLSHKMPGASVRRSSINLLLKSGWYPVRTCRLPL